MALCWRISPPSPSFRHSRSRNCIRCACACERVLETAASVSWKETLFNPLSPSSPSLPFHPCHRECLVSDKEVEENVPTKQHQSPLFPSALSTLASGFSNRERERERERESCDRSGEERERERGRDRPFSSSTVCRSLLAAQQTVVLSLSLFLSLSIHSSASSL